MRRMVWAGSLSYLLVGFSTVVFGSLFPVLLPAYHRGYLSVGAVVFGQFAGFLTGVLGMHRVTGRLGYRAVIIAACVLLALSQGLLALLPSWFGIVLLSAASGLGFGTAQSAIGAYLLQSVRSRKAVVMSLLEVAFGVGAFTMPLISGLLIASGPWRLSFAVVSVFAVAVAFLWATAPKWEFPDASDRKGRIAPLDSPGGRRGKQAARNRRLWAAFVAMFLLYVGLETSIINFLPSVLVERSRLSTAASGLGVSCFWSAMVAGRSISGVAAERIGYVRYLSGSMFATLVALVLFAFLAPVASEFVAIGLLGLSMSGIFAVSLVFANDKIGGDTARTTGILIAAGGMGGAAVPVAVGWGMERAAAGGAVWMWVAVGLLLYFAFLYVRVA